DLCRDAFLFQADGFFDGNLTERIHGHFDVGQIDTRMIRLHSYFYVVIDDTFDSDKNLHRFLVGLRWNKRALYPRKTTHSSATYLQKRPDTYGEWLPAHDRLVIRPGRSVYTGAYLNSNGGRIQTNVCLNFEFRYHEAEFSRG